MVRGIMSGSIVFCEVQSVNGFCEFGCNEVEDDASMALMSSLGKVLGEFKIGWLADGKNVGNA